MRARARVFACAYVDACLSERVEVRAWVRACARAWVRACVCVGSCMCTRACVHVFKRARACVLVLMNLRGCVIVPSRVFAARFSPVFVRQSVPLV